jgi:hypothetical protein
MKMVDRHRKAQDDAYLKDAEAREADEPGATENARAALERAAARRLEEESDQPRTPVRDAMRKQGLI